MAYSNKTGVEMKVLYISPLFSDGDVRRKFMIEEKGVKYHAKRDQAVLALMELGGINAPDTAEVRAHMKAIRSARRAIERNGYYATPAQ
jgi:hypothetical protein